MFKIMTLALFGMIIGFCFHFPYVEAGGASSKIKVSKLKKKQYMYRDDEQEEEIKISLPSANGTEVTHGRERVQEAPFNRLELPSVNVYTSSENSGSNFELTEEIEDAESFRLLERKEMCCQQNLTSLEVLNYIEHPEEVTSLYLRYNKIERIPGYAFSRFKNLRELYLDHNHITQIDPNAFWGLKQLEELDLSSNQLETLPEGVFNPISTTIKSLNVADNKVRIARGQDFKVSYNLPWDMQLIIELR